jgi:Putative Ig domain
MKVNRRRSCCWRTVKRLRVHRAESGHGSRAKSLSVAFVFIGLLAGCGGNSSVNNPVSTAPVQPSNLVYPQTTIAATVGQAIATDTPTVSGTVASYSVNPALPAGLNLDASTGAISGTPTAASPQASYEVTAQNSVGSITATLQIMVNPAAPSNLVYPQGTISATVGQALAPDTPTVSGTVNSFGINPALPAGLVLDSSTGTISGTPTSASAQATYTVFASNATGSTSTTLQISVGPSVSNLVYLQTTILAIVGQPITPDIPSVFGTVSSYSVSPALPAGLSLNISTGTISGTPTATAAQNSYTVTAQDSFGSTTATLTVSVVQAPNILLELGQANKIAALRFASGRVMSADYAGHWVLWNYSSGALLASGDGTQPNQLPDNLLTKPIDMAGQTAVAAIANGLEVVAASDGHLLSVIDYPGLNIIAVGASPVWWQLASDGSYVCIGSQAGLFVFSPTGQTLVSKAGDYSSANAFAAPGQVLVALGPAGANVIETLSTSDGTSTVGPTFSGQFNSWFLDGTHFLTNLDDTVWVYSNTSVQQAIVSLPTIDNLTGQGKWIWTYASDIYGGPLEIYPIGSDTPVLSYSAPVDTVAVPSGTTIGLVFQDTGGQASVIDLSGATPVKTDYNNIPVASLNAYAAFSASQWVVGNNHGVLVDGASLSATPRYFGYGAAWSIAGTSGTVVVSTAIGQILIYDPSGPSLQKTIDFSSGKLALSSDGTVLGASTETFDSQYGPPQALNFYSLPSGSVISSFPYSIPATSSSQELFDFTLSASGATIGRVTGTVESGPLTRQVTPISGGSASWTDTGGDPVEVDPILLSPDGTSIADYNGSIGSGTATNIIHNGALVTAVPAVGIGWIDDSRLLANLYQANPEPEPGFQYNGAVIYNPAGQQVAAPALPELKSVQTVTSDSVYDPSHNAIYSLTTGEPLWTGSLPSTGVGAVSGTYVAYGSAHSVVLESY